MLSSKMFFSSHRAICKLYSIVYVLAFLCAFGDFADRVQARSTSRASALNTLGGGPLGVDPWGWTLG